MSGTKQTAIVNAPPENSPLYIMAEKYNIAPQRLMQVLCATVIKGKTSPSMEEVAAFVIVANQYGLNPWTREIHAFVSDGRVVPIVGIDGWSRIVNRNPDFDGVEFTEALDEQGNPESTTCTIFVKGRSHHVRVTEWFDECKRNTIPWQSMKRRMLRHKSFIQCARLAFGLAGIYDEDEARDIMRNADRPTVATGTIDIDALTPSADPNRGHDGTAAPTIQAAPDSADKAVAAGKAGALRVLTIPDAQRATVGETFDVGGIVQSATGVMQHGPKFYRKAMIKDEGDSLMIAYYCAKDEPKPEEGAVVIARSVEVKIDKGDRQYWCSQLEPV